MVLLTYGPLSKQQLPEYSLFSVGNTEILYLYQHIPSVNVQKWLLWLPYQHMLIFQEYRSIQVWNYYNIIADVSLCNINDQNIVIDGSR